MSCKVYDDGSIYISEEWPDYDEIYSDGVGFSIPMKTFAKIVDFVASNATKDRNPDNA